MKIVKPNEAARYLYDRRFNKTNNLTFPLEYQLYPLGRLFDKLNITWTNKDKFNFDVNHGWPRFYDKMLDLMENYNEMRQYVNGMTEFYLKFKQFLPHNTTIFIHDVRNRFNKVRSQLISIFIFRIKISSLSPYKAP